MKLIVKTKTYQDVEKTIKAVIDAKSHPVSNMANFSAILHSEFKHHWIGFYLVDSMKNQLYLGPFQGPLACTHIPFGKGVCGSSWENKQTYIVDDVHKFPGHIACSSLTNSEIVVPLIKNDKVVGVLDIDSTEFGKFDHIDQTYLEKLCEYLCFNSF